MKILHHKQMEQMMSVPAILDAIEQGFVLHSKGETVIPPVASLHFDRPLGDCLKIASGFSDNPKLGIPAGNGLLLLFVKETGQIVALLLDEGYLTERL